MHNSIKSPTVRSGKQIYTEVKWVRVYYSFVSPVISNLSFIFIRPFILKLLESDGYKKLPWSSSSKASQTQTYTCRWYPLRTGPALCTLSTIDNSTWTSNKSKLCVHQFTHWNSTIDSNTSKNVIGLYTLWSVLDCLINYHKHK